MSMSQRKMILITGASSGIGRSTCLYLAQKGYRVIGTSRAQARLADLQAEGSREDLPLVTVELDITSDAAVDGVLPAIVEQHGGVDVLVNNAGYGLWGPMEGLSMHQIRDQFEANFFAAIRLIKAVLPGMVHRGRGTIINVSSIAGRIGTPFNSGYTASKFALEGLSESLRLELWPLGIRVAVIEPALFRTGFHRNQVMSEGMRSGETPYTPYLRRYEDRHARYRRRQLDPIMVAKVIHKVIRSRRPAFRYPVGMEAWLGTLGARLLPERIFQAMISRATVR